LNSVLSTRAQSAPIWLETLNKDFKISIKGIDAVIEALSYNPWSAITKYVVQKEKDRTVLSVPICPPQIARQKHRKNEFLCKNMHLMFFANFAKTRAPSCQTRSYESVS
jgi:hypothetical protein